MEAYIVKVNLLLEQGKTLEEVVKYFYFIKDTMEISDLYKKSFIRRFFMNLNIELDSQLLRVLKKFLLLNSEMTPLLKDIKFSQSLGQKGNVERTWALAQ